MLFEAMIHTQNDSSLRYVCLSGTPLFVKAKVYAAIGLVMGGSVRRNTASSVPVSVVSGTGCE